MTFTQSPISFAMLSIATSFSAFAESQSSQDSQEQAIEVTETITVQSDFREETLQTIPSSLTIMSAADMDTRNAQNLEELTGAVANVNFAAGSQRARYYQVRGIGERSQYQEVINPSVGIVMDDIDLAGIGGIASTFDIGQVEFFKGPQGSRFGANALAGLIYLQSNAPTDEFEGRVRLSAANYDSFSTGLVLSGPATDRVNYRLVAEKNVSDGFMENRIVDADGRELNRDDTNNRDELTLRGKLAIAATDNLDVDITLIHADFDNGYDGFSLDNSRETFSDQPGFDQQQTTAASVKFTYTGQDAFDLITIVTHANSDLAYGYDEDWSYVGLHPWEYSSTDHYLRDRQNSTLELRLVSKPEQRIFTDTTDWVIGVYGKNDQEDLTRQYTYLASDFTSSFDAQNLAIFAELQTHLSDALTLTTGLRIEQRDIDYVNSDGLDYQPEDTMLGGKLLLAYQLSDAAMTYASINRGYKAGSVNSNGTLSDELRAFDPEYLWNYELGFKTSLLDNRAVFRAAVFYMTRDDIQISSYHLDERADGSSEFISFWDNAATGNNAGVEVEFLWDISDSLNIYTSLGLLNTEFSGFTYGDGTKETGRDQAHAPNYQFNAGANYYITDRWLLNVNVEGKDEFYFSDSHIEKSDSVVLWASSLSYQADNWRVKLWGRNVFDELYATRGFYFGNDPRDGYEAKPYYQFGEPARIGLTFDYNF
ncbi:TonB-dependent receptor [Thalassotalea mangrovi]|uniref:TonB-dependent receptor n=1 Tax=Thalassotalea mangrovi TaxID=2572245 RepID=A0A4U1B8G8_9GAMM|nr:TonB-dependent receptor [Thalassotalea mangrovi]TKB46315.1 TonB-dependent receptor [Thalassotalea mangrovi]